MCFEAAGEDYPKMAGNASLSPALTAAIRFETD